MGRPLKSVYFGNPATSAVPVITLTSAFIPGANAPSVGTIYILKQTGVSRFNVTDGTNTGNVTLVGYDNINPGEATLLVSVFPNNTTEHARVILDHVVKTWEDNVYDWSYETASLIGQANLPFA